MGLLVVSVGAAVVGPQLLAQAGAGDPAVSWFELITRGGLLGLLTLVIGAILTKRLVPGWVYEAKDTECERRVNEARAREAEWRSIALSGTQVLQRQQQVVEHVVGVTPPGA